MKTSRTKLNESILFVIYDALTFAYINVELNIEKMLSDYFDLPYEVVEPYAKEVFIKSLKNKDSIIIDLQKNMSNWKFDRLNRLAQAILLLAVTHYRYVEKVDKKIVIDTAVRMAKKYLDDGDYKLINAVLDKTL